jgi:hypothetical protein
MEQFWCQAPSTGCDDVIVTAAHRMPGTRWWCGQGISRTDLVQGANSGANSRSSRSASAARRTFSLAWATATSSRWPPLG